MDKFIVLIYRLLHNLNDRSIDMILKKNQMRTLRHLHKDLKLLLTIFLGIFFLEFVHALTEHAFKIRDNQIRIKC